MSLRLGLIMRENPVVGFIGGIPMNSLLTRTSVGYPLSTGMGFFEVASGGRRARRGITEVDWVHLSDPQ
jgi:hypothetical protein